MSTDARPPIRQTKSQQWGGNTLRYDTWGAGGRPVLLLHSVLFDRSMWWPAAAELQQHAAPIAVDLPGHGESPAREGYDPQALVDELASLLHEQRLMHAPVIVGHGASAGLASVFARRFVTRALVLVDPYVRPSPRRNRPRVDDMLDLLNALESGMVPSYLRVFARPSGGVDLFDAYRSCTQIDPWANTDPGAPPPTAYHSTRLLICRRLQGVSARRALRESDHSWRCHWYGRATGFPHLSDVERFCSEIGALL